MVNWLGTLKHKGVNQGFGCMSHTDCYCYCYYRYYLLGLFRGENILSILNYRIDPSRIFQTDLPQAYRNIGTVAVILDAELLGLSNIRRPTYLRGALFLQGYS